MRPVDGDVFVGRPAVRWSVAGEKATLQKLSGSDALQSECRIVRIGDSYYWASRAHKKLLRTESGYFTYFVNPEGTGYIKVFSGKRGAPLNPDWDYMEHATFQFETITYWGKVKNGR